MIADRLATIVDRKREEVASLKPRADELRDQAATADAPRGFAAALRDADEVKLLAEIKRRSPSAGSIREDAEPAAIAGAYQAGGAAALSVLTDRDFFGGSLDALREARAAVSLPILRKDFVVDPVQVWEARAVGADAILLIVRILDDEQLRDLLQMAEGLGMDVLVEIHDPAELERAVNAGATVLGVNNRDLTTFRTDLGLSLRLSPTIDPSLTLVAESGIRTADDVRRLGDAGVNAILVGESLMRQDDVEKAAAALSGHPRNDSIRSR